MKFKKGNHPKSEFKKGNVPINPFKKGNLPWNKGLTKQTDKSVKVYGEKHSLAMKKLYTEGNMIPWNKGLTKETDNRILEKGKNYPKNRKSMRLTKEQIYLKKQRMTGEKNPNFNKNKSEFDKYKIQCRFTFKIGDFLDEFEVFKIRNMFHPFKNKKGYTRDHMLSIYDGFKNGINSDIVSHPANCMIISHSENSRKNKMSVITEEELRKKIIHWEEKHGRFNTTSN